jgi:hypothetical protein
MSINILQFTWPTTFSCTLITDQIVVPNLYSLGVSIEPASGNPNNITTGLKKIKIFVDQFLQNSIIVKSDHELVKSFEHIETNLVLLPNEPYDYAVGNILYNKLSAITEKYFHIDMITIDSALGDNIQYCITDLDDDTLSGNHWWNMDTADTGSKNPQNWNDLVDIKDCGIFEPQIIKGGLSDQ